MNPVSGSILIILLLTVAFAPRRWALLAMMAGILFLTQGQSVSIVGLSIWPLRFLEVAAFARVIVRREFAWSQLNRIDGALLVAYNYTALVWIVRSSEGAAEQVAFALDPTISYLALRGLLRDIEELRWLLIALIGLLVPFTVLVVLERVTGQTSFALVGANWVLYVRDGIARCSGAFRHASLLGSVAAAFFALYVGLWWRKQDRVFAVVGISLCLALVILSNSGGPATSALAATAGWMLWPLRHRMRHVRYAILGILLLLILFMKAPIWYLPFKISMVVGGGGYHRGALMESAWNDLGRWWLFGLELKETLPWIPYAHGETGGVDVTNEFIVFAIKGGLAALFLLVLVLHRALAGIGHRVKSVRSSRGSRAHQALVWGVGVAIFVHAVSWLGIAYFDQSWMIWLLHLAAVSASTECVTELKRRERVSSVAVRRDLVLQPAFIHGKQRARARLALATFYRPELTRSTRTSER